MLVWVPESSPSYRISFLMIFCEKRASMLLMLILLCLPIIVSIWALSGDTVYARPQYGLMFSVVLGKNPVPPGQKKLLRGASKSLPSWSPGQGNSLPFFDIFGSEFPYTGLHFGTLQRGSVEEALCQHTNTMLQKSIFLQKNVFAFVFLALWSFEH